MVNILGKAVSFIQTVPSRWGTQIRSIQSVLKVQEPLKSYALLLHAADTLKPPHDESFWQRLQSLNNLFKRLHELQVMSESNKSGLNKVYPCWIEINTIFQEMRQPGSNSWWFDVNEYCCRKGQGGFDDRIEKQLLPIHIAAHMLTPVNRDTSLLPKLRQKVDDYIIEKIGHDGYGQWLDYIDQQGEFNVTRPCWTNFTENPRYFWRHSVRINHF
jgi:hypothetical protein